MSTEGNGHLCRKSKFYGYSYIAKIINKDIYDMVQISRRVFAEQGNA